MPCKKLPPHCMLLTKGKVHRIRFRKLGASHDRHPIWLWYSPDASEQSYVEAWKMYYLTEDLAHFGQYTVINKHVYDPDTSQHLTKAFTDKFKKSQKLTVGIYHKQPTINAMIAAVRHKYLQSNRPHCDSMSMVRDIQPHTWLSSRLSRIRKLGDAIGNIRIMRQRICSKLLPVDESLLELNDIRTSNAQSKIAHLLLPNKDRKIHIRNKACNVSDVIKVEQCGIHYRIPTLRGQNQLIAMQDIPPNVIIGIYDFMMLPIDVFNECHRHPMVMRQHGAYALTLSMQSLNLNHLRDIVVSNICDLLFQSVVTTHL